MIDRFRRFAAVNTAVAGMKMDRLTPAPIAQLGTEILEENRIPAVHPNTSAVESLT
jgi:hypothetical protein